MILSYILIVYLSSYGLSHVLLNIIDKNFDVENNYYIHMYIPLLNTLMVLILILLTIFTIIFELLIVIKNFIKR